VAYTFVRVKPELGEYGGRFRKHFGIAIANTDDGFGPDDAGRSVSGTLLAWTSATWR